jgi:hypothetical protein
MTGDSIYQGANYSRASVDVDVLKASSLSKRRKHNGFRVIVRKLFGRKLTKSHISLPTPTHKIKNVSRAASTLGLQ